MGEVVTNIVLAMASIKAIQMYLCVLIYKMRE